MSLPFLLKDRDDHSIQTLAPDDTTVVQATIAAGNSRAALPTGAQIVEIASTDFCRIAFGDVTVDATAGTRRIFPAGAATYRIPDGADHFAVTQVGASSGVVTVTRLF